MTPFALVALLLTAVVDKTPNGFTVKETIKVAAAPAEAYRLLTEPGKWWENAHTYSGSAKNMTIAAKAGGCFCEKVGTGEVQHMTVVFAVPGQMLRLTGGLGPLQSAGVSGSLSFELKPSGTGSEIAMTYSVGGYMQGSLSNFADPVDGVLHAQLASYQKLMESLYPPASR